MTVIIICLCSAPSLTSHVAQKPQKNVPEVLEYGI